MLKKEVLRQERDFNAVYRKGKSVPDRFVVVFYKPNGLEYNRFCYLASKKVGNSVQRNRARRLMKESVRLGEPLKEGYDLIFIARNSIAGKNLKEVSGSIDRALGRTPLRKKKRNGDRR